MSMTRPSRSDCLNLPLNSVDGVSLRGHKGLARGLIGGIEPQANSQMKHCSPADTARQANRGFGPMLLGNVIPFNRRAAGPGQTTRYHYLFTVRPFCVPFFRECGSRVRVAPVSLKKPCRERKLTSVQFAGQLTGTDFESYELAQVAYVSPMLRLS